MKLDQTNTFLKQKNNAYQLCVAIPDGSRNYLHSHPTVLRNAIMYLQDLEGQRIGNWNTSIKEEETYFRIISLLNVGTQLNGKNDIELEFHGRKLNLNDAVYEYRMLISNEEGLIEIR